MSKTIQPPELDPTEPDLSLTGTPEEAVGLFREWNIEMPHRFDESVAAERRKVTCQDHSFGGGARQRRNAFGKEVDVKQCVICAAKCEIPGTTKWWGVGQYSYMADLTTDHQRLQQQVPPTLQQRPLQMRAIASPPLQLPRLRLSLSLIWM